jgi:hypothetical protein
VQFNAKIDPLCLRIILNPQPMLLKLKSTLSQIPLKAGDKLPLALVIFSAILVCIWPMQHTIALRNLLLGLCGVLGIAYTYVFFKTSTASYPFKIFLPLIFLGLMFLWVAFHYFFLSQDPIAQYRELTSTWLRCAASVIVGFSVGLVITQHPKWIRFLWLGIFISFLILYAQYIPRVWQTHSLIQYDYFTYVFYGKHNAVMAGTLLLCGALAMLLDVIEVQHSFKALLWSLGFSLIAFATVLFAYTHLFDTRNGIGLAVILVCFAVAWCGLGLFKKSGKYPSKPLMLAAIGAMMALTFAFAYQQTQSNMGWKYFAEDLQTSVQIDRFPNWQDPGSLGYPTTPSGRVVTGNTYERAAWATAATRLIGQNPLGNGLLHFSFGRAAKAVYPDSKVKVSHSAWLELGLAFGIPALVLMLGALLLLLQKFLVTRHSPFSNLGVLLSVALMLLYSVAELIGQHGLEGLFFWIGVLSGLQFWAISLEKSPSSGSDHKVKP